MFKTLTMLIAVLTITACAESNNDADKDNNDTFETAKTILPDSPVNGSIDVDSDEYDYYQFNITEISDIEITFTNSTDLDAYIGLYKENQSKVTTGYGYNPAHSDVKTISETLEPGLYYILVEAYNYSSNYTLSLTINRRAQLEPENNNLESMELGDTRQGSINGTNTQDTYQFTLTETTYTVAEVTSNVEGRTPDLYVDLKDSEGNVLDFNHYSESDKRAIVDKTLEPGTYTIIIQRFFIDVYDYQLRLFDGSL